MANRLSHSSVNKFSLCGKSYEYHYVKRIRPSVTSGALLFGDALDKAVNALLMKTDESPEVVFERTFTQGKINDVFTYIPTSVKIVYSNADFDSDLLTQADYSSIKEQTEKGELPGYTNHLEIYKELKDKKQDKGFDSLSFDQKKFYNYMNWLSMRRKGFLMLDAYRKKVLPKIEKVHEVQVAISLDNENGDSIIGYVDLVADIKGVGTVILDNKTSASEYKEDSVLTSPQLSLYVHALEEKYKTRKAGYIVMRKSIIKNRKKVCSVCGFDGSGARHKTCSNEIEGKRCGGEWTETLDPDVYIQFITDEIPEKTEAIVLENYDLINRAINTGIFTRNLNSCTNFFGGLCPYFSLCYHDKMNNLTDLNKKDIDNTDSI